MIVWWPNQSQSSSADGLMALMALVEAERKAGDKRDWFEPQGAESWMEGYMVLLKWRDG